MKKVKKSPDCPTILRDFLNFRPDGTWELFTQSEQAGKQEVQNQLVKDQHGLCAYCEIEISPGKKSRGLGDFRVDHFHPKRRPPNPPPNWDLEWTNLLAVCCGGSQKYLDEADRYTHPDFSCDVPKADRCLDGIILNPLQIETPDLLFSYDEDGRMVPASGLPPPVATQAAMTIEILRLSELPDQAPPATRLDTRRRGVIAGLRIQLEQLVGAGLSIDEAATEVAEAVLTLDPNDTWPQFFSCIRWYLGPAAEARLTSLGYDG